MTVIICKECGHHNQDQDAFCSSCGTFLEWSGERVAEPAPPPPEPPRPAPPPPGLVDRVKQAVGIESAPPPPVPPARPPAEQAGQEAAGGRVPPAAVSARTAAPDAPPGAEPPVIPATPPRVVPRLEAVPPTASVQRPARRPVTAPPPADETGVTCASCGAGNDLRRHFCRRCGAVLARPSPGRLPWYRRLFARRPPAPGTAPTAAPTRAVRPPGPTPGRVLRTFLLTVAGALLLVTLLAYAVSPGFRLAADHRVAGAVTEVRRLLNPNYERVRPPTAVASSQVSEHPGQFANDLVSNDYWAADLARDPQPTLVLTFSGPTNLDYALFTSGAPGADHARLGRPRTVQITYSDGTGESLTLHDDQKPIGVNLHGHQVTSTTLKITGAYPGSGSTAVALTEVEFFRLG